MTKNHVSKKSESDSSPRRKKSKKSCHSYTWAEVPNKKRLRNMTHAQRAELHKLLGEFRSTGVGCDNIVDELLSISVELTTRHAVSIKSAYVPFVDALAQVSGYDWDITWFDEYRSW